MCEEQQTPEKVHELHLNTGNGSDNFKTWKREVEIYLRASGTTQLDKSFLSGT